MAEEKKISEFFGDTSMEIIYFRVREMMKEVRYFALYLRAILAITFIRVPRTTHGPLNAARMTHQHRVRKSPGVSPGMIQILFLPPKVLNLKMGGKD